MGLALVNRVKEDVNRRIQDRTWKRIILARVATWVPHPAEGWNYLYFTELGQ